MSEANQENEPFGPGGTFGLKVSDLKLALNLAIRSASAVHPESEFVRRLSFALRGFDEGKTCQLIYEKHAKNNRLSNLFNAGGNGDAGEQGTDSTTHHAAAAEDDPRVGADDPRQGIVE